MEKSVKLARYGRKDYTETVEFPVEIVGRDGVVRRYSFEDSIRLYQRRITFAPIRYRDTDLITAEVSHCRSRIDQLRRSYFHRFGWGTPTGDADPEEVFGELAGELAAFVCRVMRCEGRPEVRLEAVDETADRSTWYLIPAAHDTGMLLYVHRFEGEDADRVREAFFADLKKLERIGRDDGDGERLIAFHHTADCGFVLTARGSEFDVFAALRDVEAVDRDRQPSPWDDVVDVIRRGEYGRALKQCRQLVEDQPFHRKAYVAGAMLGLSLGQYIVAEDLAMIGARYFPGDGLLHYYTGVSRVRQGRVAEGVGALYRALELDGSLTAARFNLAVHLLDDNRYRAAARVLRGASGEGDRRGEALVHRLRQWVRWRRVMVGAGLVSLVLGVGATALGGAVGLVPVVMGVVMAWSGAIAFRRQFEQIVARSRFDDVSHGLRRINRYAPDVRDEIL